MDEDGSLRATEPDLGETVVHVLLPVLRALTRDAVRVTRRARRHHDSCFTPHNVAHTYTHDKKRTRAKQGDAVHESDVHTRRRPALDASRGSIPNRCPAFSMQDGIESGAGASAVPCSKSKCRTSLTPLSRRALSALSEQFTRPKQRRCGRANELVGRAARALTAALACNGVLRQRWQSKTNNSDSDSNIDRRSGSDTCAHENTNRRGRKGIDMSRNSSYNSSSSNSSREQSRQTNTKRECHSGSSARSSDSSSSCNSTEKTCSVGFFCTVTVQQLYRALTRCPDAEMMLSKLPPRPRHRHHRATPDPANLPSSAVSLSSSASLSSSSSSSSSLPASHVLLSASSSSSSTLSRSVSSWWTQPECVGVWHCAKFRQAIAALMQRACVRASHTLLTDKSNNNSSSNGNTITGDSNTCDTLTSNNNYTKDNNRNACSSGSLTAREALHYPSEVVTHARRRRIWRLCMAVLRPSDELHARSSSAATAPPSYLSASKAGSALDMGMCSVKSIRGCVRALRRIRADGGHGRDARRKGAGNSSRMRNVSHRWFGRCRAATELWRRLAATPQLHSSSASSLSSSSGSSLSECSDHSSQASVPSSRCSSLSLDLAPEMSLPCATKRPRREAAMRVEWVPVCGVEGERFDDSAVTRVSHVLLPSLHSFARAAGRANAKAEEEEAKRETKIEAEGREEEEGEEAARQWTAHCASKNDHLNKPSKNSNNNSYSCHPSGLADSTMRRRSSPAPEPSASSCCSTFSSSSSSSSHSASSLPDSASALDEVSAVLATVSRVFTGRTSADDSAWQYGRNRIAVASVTTISLPLSDYCSTTNTISSACPGVTSAPDADADSSRSVSRKQATKECGGAMELNRAAMPPQLVGVFMHETGMLYPTAVPTEHAGSVYAMDVTSEERW